MVTLKLRTAPNVNPFEEIDLTGNAGLVIAPPSVYDARSENESGAVTVSKRAIRRRFRVDAQKLTDAQVALMEGWKYNRARVSFNPNWNANTTFYARLSRADKYTGKPGAVIGPAPTFSRTIGSSNASATKRLPSGLLQPIGLSVPRFERSTAGNAFGPLWGLRPYGRHSNYFGQTHPKNGALMWTLNNPSGNGSWSWGADFPRIVTDAATGAGRFTGESGDNLQVAVATYGGAGTISVGVWVYGEGTFQLVLSGGATGSTSNTVLSPGTWTLLKVEGVTASGASVTVQLFSRLTTSRCSVSAMMFHRERRLLGYTHNIVNTTVYELQADALFYDTQIPDFGTTLHVGLEMPDLYVTAGEQAILGVDLGTPNRFVLRYNPVTAKFSFQSRTSGGVVEWTPERAAGQGTIISIHAGKDLWSVYENGNVKVSTAAAKQHIVPRGLHVGWDGVTDTLGWNGLIYFVRMDSAPLDLAEIAYVSSMWNDAAQRRWARAFEGRLFEVTGEQFGMIGARHVSAFDLVEVDSYDHATTEEA